LEYHIGITDPADIQFRLFGNTAAGIFSKEWVRLDDVVQAFKRAPNDKPLTSHLLNTVYQGRSTNSSGFLLAAMLNEGLIRRTEGVTFGYDRNDDAEFMAGIEKLIASGVDLKVEENVSPKPAKVKLDTKGAEDAASPEDDSIPAPSKKGKGSPKK
jgi:hypothetical protein